MNDDKFERLESAISIIQEKIILIDKRLYAALVVAAVFGLAGAWGWKTIIAIKTDLGAAEARLTKVQLAVSDSLKQATTTLATARDKAIADVSAAALVESDKISHKLSNDFPIAIVQDALRQELGNYRGQVTGSSLVIFGSSGQPLIELGELARGDGHITLYGQSNEVAVEIEAQNNAGRVAAKGPRGSVEADAGMADGDLMPRLEVTGYTPECWTQPACSSPSSSIFRAYLEADGTGSVGGFVGGEYWSARGQ